VNNVKNIIIAESSKIIYEGLRSVINEINQSIGVIIVNSLDEIYNSHNKYNLDLVIINPALLQNNTNTFNKLLSEFEGTKWVGILYQYFDKELLNNMDDIIYINDPPEIIKRKIIKNLTHAKNRLNVKTRLSKREIDVLKALVEGNSNKEIADKLCISIYTVMSHRKRISQKTGIKSVSGLTIYAVVNKIITLENYSV
jgi:DNA-binding NarL/FixJ family response regulator